MNRRAAQPWYAVGARQLLEARQAGHVPDGPVAVALDHHNGRPNALFVRDDMPLERMDWRMLVNVQVWLLASPSVALDRVLRAARDIARVRPARLTLRFEAGGQLHDVDVGSAHHVAPFENFPAVHEFTWHPLDLTLTSVGARLRQALVSELPMWSTL